MEYDHAEAYLEGLDDACICRRCGLQTAACMGTAQLSGLLIIRLCINALMMEGITTGSREKEK